MNLTETIAASLAAATALAFANTMIPAPLLLPLFSIVAVIAAFSIAFFAWIRAAARRTEHVNAWDISGALLFVGFAAALLSNPESALAFFEQANELRTASIANQ